MSLCLCQDDVLPIVGQGPKSRDRPTLLDCLFVKHKLGMNGT